MLMACLLVIGLSSCEGTTYLDWSIDNQTEEALTVVHKYTDLAPPSTFSVSPGEQLLLGHNDYLGANSTPFDPSSFIDTLEVYSLVGKLMTKDWTKMENWGVSSSETSKRPTEYTHVYVLVVTEDDF